MKPKRKTVGRKPSGRKPYLIRMFPKTKSNLDKLAGEKSVGEFLEEKYP